jgi:hypothetical protein
VTPQLARTSVGEEAGGDPLEWPGGAGVLQGSSEPRGAEEERLAFGRPLPIYYLLSQGGVWGGVGGGGGWWWWGFPEARRRG